MLTIPAQSRENEASENAIQSKPSRFKNFHAVLGQFRSFADQYSFHRG
jgi:hypothetical protein